MSEIKYCYNDINIVPAEISTITHRNECNPFLGDGFLPIFTAPMSSVINKDNFGIFEKNKINAILPRTEDLCLRKEYCLKDHWTAFSLDEFKDFLCDEGLVHLYEKVPKKALIDVANGHMEIIYKLVAKAKNLYGHTLNIMVGNIANPKTYIRAWQSGADFCRMSIGSGMGCITSSNTGIGYPIASLIKETFEVKLGISKEYGIPMHYLPKIVADGGIRNYSDVNKALALGADYVMIGGLFSSLIESSANTYYIGFNNNIIDVNNKKYGLIREENNELFLNDPNGVKIKIDKLYKNFYGMASKEGQIVLNGKKTKTSEGISKVIEATTNIDKWVSNMASYLRSCMSYTNIKNVECMNTLDTVIISNNSFNSINK